MVDSEPARRTRSASRVLIATLVLIGLVALTIWCGFRWPSLRAPPPGAQASRLAERTVLYDGLPAPLQYYLAQTVGRTPYVTTTALVWGTGSIRAEFGPIRVWLPVRWQEAIDLARGYVWTGEVLWWRWVILRLEDRWVDGEGMARLDGELLSSAHAGHGQAMRAKAEYVWMPSALLTDPDIVWHAQSASIVVMRFPSEEPAERRPDTGTAPKDTLTKPADRDSLVMEFDRRTKALVALTGTRRRNDSTAVTWSLGFTAWDAPGGLAVPVAGHAAWDGKPYYRFGVEGISYNVSVEEWFRSKEEDG